MLRFKVVLSINICILIHFFFLTNYDLHAETDKNINFIVYGGLIIPNSTFGTFQYNNQVSYFVNDTSKQTGTLNLVKSNTGYLIGIIAMNDLNDDYQFYGGLEFNRIYTKENKVLKNNSEEIYSNIDVSTTIIPITLGMNYYFIKNKYGLYLSGDLSYNFITYSIDYPIEKVVFDLPKSTNENRFGYSIGIGFEYVLDKMILNLEYRIKNYNFIGTIENEDKKFAHLIKLGFIF